MFSAYGVAGHDLASVLDETGTPAGWYPLVAGYDAVPDLPDEVAVSPDLLAPLAAAPRRTLAPAELAELKARLRALYEAGPGQTVETEEAASEPDEEDEGEGDSIASGARIPIPAETFLEELAQKVEVHPISVYWLLRELRETDGVVCGPERRRFVEDYLSVMVLRLLGHRWPREVESEAPSPAWAEDSGIIPITEGTGRRTLLARVRDRLAEDFSADRVNAIEREIAEIVGKPLGEWLAGDFFTRHISQFRKRPIAWQIQSAPGERGGRRGRSVTPKRNAFACLVYYHHLDADLVPNLRTQLVGPLVASFQTELADLDRSKESAGGDDARRFELGERIRELQSLDRRLSEVGADGFGGPAMTRTLRQRAIDDAVLCAKERWLRRLAQAIDSGPLTAWLAEAREARVHEGVPRWVSESIRALPHHCSAVAPAPPDEGSLSSDPGPREVAALIAPEWKGMIGTALALACERWWRRLAVEVFQPLRERITEREGETKALVLAVGGRKNRKDLTGTERDRVASLEGEVKRLKEELEEKKQRAQSLRDRIEAWTCEEAAGWESWLAGQPLYDQASAADGRRAPPDSVETFMLQEASYLPDVNDGVRVNIAPLQSAGLLAADVVASKDLAQAIADRAQWRADERRWCREGKLPQPGWWSH